MGKLTNHLRPIYLKWVGVKGALGFKESKGLSKNHPLGHCLRFPLSPSFSPKTPLPFLRPVRLLTTTIQSHQLRTLQGEQLALSFYFSQFYFCKFCCSEETVVVRCCSGRVRCLSNFVKSAVLWLQGGWTIWRDRSWESSSAIWVVHNMVRRGLSVTFKLLLRCLISSKVCGT